MAITSTNKRSTSKKPTAPKTASSVSKDAAAIQKLEARCDRLEKAITSLVSEKDADALSIKNLEAVVEALSTTKSGSNDPRVDQLIPKLRALVSKIQNRRGAQPSPWPRF